MTDIAPNKPTPISDDPLVRKLALKGLASLALTLLAILFVGYYLYEPVTNFAVQALEILGPLGLFFGVFASDAFGFPIPLSTYLFAAIAADAPVVLVLTITVVASLSGASLAYFLGPFLTRLPFLGRFLERHRPRGEALFDRWGVWTIGLAAVTPLPFPVFCWLAGIYKMPFKRFFSATLVRAPRILAYYGLFALGWAGAAALA